MAIYHCSVQIIGRNAGRSSVAAAAYRAGVDLVNEYDGIEHDFTKKNWVEYTEIILPGNAPKEYQDRNILWNAVELAEKTKDAQLAREFELALPIELSRVQQIEIVQQFVRNNLISQGMIADISIHNPPKTNDRHQPIDENGNITRDVKKMQFINPHAHILCTVRPMDEQGKWEKKAEVEYLCKKNGEERAFTATEFSEAKKDGWEKQYRYYEGKQKVYYTPSEVAEKDLTRVNRTPKTTPYGRKNKTVEYWNAKNRIFEWRQSWEQVVNDKFMSINSELHIDSRSFKEQGREDEIPSLHMGVAAINMEKRANREMKEGKTKEEIHHSDIGNINQQIKEHNALVKALRAKLETVTKKAKDFIEITAKKLEAMRAKLIGNGYEQIVFTKKYHSMERVLASEKDILEKYRIETQKVSNANAQSSETMETLHRELKRCTPLQLKKKTEIQKLIQEEQKNIEYRIEYIQSITRKYQFFTKDDYRNAVKKYSMDTDAYKKLGKIIETLEKNSAELTKEYQIVLQAIPAESREAIKEKRLETRPEIEKMIKKKLSDKHSNSYDMDVFELSKKSVDKIITPKDVSNVKERKATISYHR